MPISVACNIAMFQFTHPGKGATEISFVARAAVCVSIHAPWEGCDIQISTTTKWTKVSIHAPWEGCDF